jgi:hypothetical protein
MSGFKCIFLTFPLLLIQADIVDARDVLPCRASFFKDESLHIAATKFSVFDKVYLRSICRQLPEGKYEFTAIWHTPSGQIQRQDTHSSSLSVTGDYGAFFWMKLLKKSPFKETFSNSSFSDKYYGLWTVNLYLNDQSVGSGSFTIQ